MASSVEEILLRVGLDASAMRTGTNQLLDEQKKASNEYVSFWTKAAAKRDAEEMALEIAKNEKSLQRYKALQASKAKVDAEWMAERAAQFEIARGSGGFGSINPVGDAAINGVERAAVHGAEQGAMDSVARRELLVMTRELSSGNYKRFFSSFSIFIQHCGKAALEIGKLTGALAGAAIAAYKLTMFGKAAGEANLARGREIGSASDAAIQAGGLGGKLDEHIDQLEEAGRITEAQADRLRSLSSGGNSDQLRAAQRFVMEKEGALARERAEAEAQVADHARAAAVAAEDKAVSEKAAAKAQAEQQKFNKEYAKLAEESVKLQTDANRLDASVPTVGDLAGRAFTNRINKDYGAGGRFDLGKGDGALGGAARESELAGKQMAWDLTYGNGRYVVGADGVGHFTGQAEVDRKRKIAADNLLGAAGLDTPAMKFEAMKQHLSSIQESMTNLLKKASTDGLVINTKD